MKRTLTIILILVCMIGYAQEGNLPKMVASAFQERYTDTKIGNWWIENGLYFLDFTIKGNSYTAVFDQEGVWKETSEVISEMEIPEILQDFVRTTFPVGRISYCEVVEGIEINKYIRVNLIDTGNVLRIVRSDQDGKNIIIQDTNP